MAVAPGLVDTPQTYSGTLSGKIVFTSGGHGWQWNTTLGRYATDRGDNNEIVEDFGNQEQMTYYADYLLRAGATVVPMRPIGRQVNEVVLDNDSAGVTFSASGWSNSSSTRFYDEDYGAGADAVPYRYASTATGAESATATYTPNIPAAGFYPVYTWVLYGSDRTTQTYRVNHTGGTTEIKVDHSKAGSGWVYLGTYHFNAGTSATGEGSVQISNKAPVAGKVVIADAIRFGNGMGDYIWTASGASAVSGYPREDENSYHWIARSIGQGATVSGLLGSVNNVSAPSEFAEYMFHGTFGEAVYVGFHSNAGGGRGARGLIDNTSPSPNQTSLASILGNQINQDMQALDGTFEHDWTDGTSATYPGDFGEINLGASAEMDATIIEVAFHDSVEDAAIMRDPTGRDQIARSVYQGTLQYFASFGTPVATNTSLPTAPKSVRAVSNTSGQVTVGWAAGASTPAAVNGAAATGYKVYASVDGYGFDGGTVLAGGGTTSVTLSGYDPTKIYYFKVAATNAGGESLASEVVAVLPSGGVKQLLIVNGFDRFDRTQNFRYPYLGQQVDRVWSRYNNSFDYVVQMANAIAGAKPGVHVASTSNEAVISGAVNLADYDTVIWISGTESTADDTFDATEQAKVTNFIAGGGNLFLSGSEIGWDLDQQNNGRTFYESTLKANYINDDAGTYTAIADPAGIFAGMSSFVFSSGSAFSSLEGQLYDVAYPDVIAPQAGAVSALSYSGGTGGTAAIQVQGMGGAGSIVMFAFPFEAMTSAARRQTAMGRILDFFDVAALSENADFNGDSIVDGGDYVVWRKNVGLASDATQSQGDANGDGAVDNTDYGIWREQFGTSPGAGSAAAMAAPGSGFAVVTIPPTIATAVGESLAASAPVETADTSAVRNAAFAAIQTEQMSLRPSLRSRSGPKVQFAFDLPNEGQQLLNVLARSKTFHTLAGLADEPIGHFSFDGCVPQDAEPGTASEFAKLSPGKKMRRVGSAF